MKELEDFKKMARVLGSEGLGYIRELKKQLKDNPEAQNRLSKIELCLDIIARNGEN